MYVSVVMMMDLVGVTLSFLYHSNKMNTALVNELHWCGLLLRYLSLESFDFGACVGQQLKHFLLLDRKQFQFKIGKKIDKHEAKV